MHMLWDYRGERWPGLLADILKKALQAAYLSASVQDYLTLALEALGLTSGLPTDHQTAIHANIVNILQVVWRKNALSRFRFIIFPYFLNDINS